MLSRVKYQLADISTILNYVYLFQLDISLKFSNIELQLLGKI